MMTPHSLAAACNRAYLHTPTLSGYGVEVLIEHPKEGTVVTFRGTDGYEDARVDLSFFPTGSRIGGVHGGFWKNFIKIWPGIAEALDIYNHATMHFTGHSKGGAEATFAAILAKRRWGEIAGLTTFGKPRCGRNLKRHLDRTEVRRFVAYGDPVPKFPAPIFFNHEFNPIMLGDELPPDVWEPGHHRISKYLSLLTP